MKLLKIIFPVYFNNKIKLSNKQLKEINKLYKKYDLLGEEMVEIEYDYKCNRSYAFDMLTQTFFTLNLLTIIILFISYIL